MLTGTGKANEKELQEARDLVKKLKDFLIELQSSYIEMEDGYKDYIQKLMEEKKSMRKRGKERLNAFKNNKNSRKLSDANQIAKQKQEIYPLKVPSSMEFSLCELAV